MKLFVMRHGEAELNARTDSDRSLTSCGRKQVVAVARRLSQMDLQVEESMVSPYLRARQTAAIMSQAMAGLWPEQVSDAITPNQSPERAALAIAECFDNTGIGLVVMHQPIIIISRLLYYLTGQDQSMEAANLAVLEAPKILLGCCELECVI